MRSGIGYDIHRLVDGTGIVLGGISIPFHKSLSGHSDADVLTHAIMDAILGAGGFKDIGHYFPTDAPEYKDISSLLLLKKVDDIIKAEGFRIVNIDSTVIAEEPKIAPFIDNMRQELSLTLGIDKQQIMVKATTNEGLGAIGEKKGIAAFAIAMLEEQR
jgi:2-C-methyl-D-erythritol 2,4-cyclodiphosphate synthase